MRHVLWKGHNVSLCDSLSNEIIWIPPSLLFQFFSLGLHMLYIIKVFYVYWLLPIHIRNNCLFCFGGLWITQNQYGSKNYYLLFVNVLLEVRILYSRITYLNEHLIYSYYNCIQLYEQKILFLHIMKQYDDKIIFFLMM